MKRTTTTTMCDRCEREMPEPEKASAPALALHAFGVQIRYEDLCEKCIGVCADHLRRIAKQPTVRKRPAKDEAKPAKVAK